MSERLCGVCGLVLGGSEQNDTKKVHGNTKYHRHCVVEAIKRQQALVAEKKRLASKYPRVVQCKAKGCGKLFSIKSHREKYCSDGCRVKGWEASVERQKELRRAEKRNKKEGDRT